MENNKNEKIAMNLPEDPNGFIYINNPSQTKQRWTLASPIIFLLGYAGCNDDTLQKFSQIYEQLDCITIRYIL